MRVESELVGDLGKRRSGCMQLRRVVQDLVVSCRLLAVARDTDAVELAGHGGSRTIPSHSRLPRGIYLSAGSISASVRLAWTVPATPTRSNKFATG